MLPPPPTKPITLLTSVVLAGRKKESTLSHVLSEYSAVQEYWACAIALIQDLHSWMPLVHIKNKKSSDFGTVHYLNQDNPVPNYPNSYTPLHARRHSLESAGGMGQ